RTPGSRVWKYSYYPWVKRTGRTWNADSVAHTQPEWAKSFLLKQLSLPTGEEIFLVYALSEVRQPGAWMLSGDLNEWLEDIGDLEYVKRAQWNVKLASKSYINSGESWTYLFSPARRKGEYDVGRVSGPGGVRVYKYFGEGFFGDDRVWQSEYVPV